MGELKPTKISLTHFSLRIFFVFLAMQQVEDTVGEGPTSTGVKDIDLLFLRGIMESPIVRSHPQVAHTQIKLRVRGCERTNL